MKSRAIVYSIAAAALAFGSLAEAQEREHRGRQDWQQQQQQGQQQQQPELRQSPERRDGRENRVGRDDRNGQRDYAQRDYVQRDSGQRDRGQWQHHQQNNSGWDGNSGWHGNQARPQRDSRYAYSQYGQYNQPRYWRGGYVPYEYRASRYYVNDWRSRQLSAPPYGYQWVQTDNGDYLLMALATGLIANLILNSY